MKVFNAFLKIMKKHIKSSVIYIVIFLAIAVLMTKSGGDANQGYENKSLKIAVTDLDDSEASRAAVEYISRGNKLVEVGESKDERLDALYFQSADVIIIIEKGYSDKLSAGETEGLFTEYSVPGTYTAEFFDSHLSRYVAMTSAYVSGGNTPAAAAAKAAESLAAEVEVSVYTKDNEPSTLNMGRHSYFQYLAYIFVAALISGLCPIILTFRKKDIASRINCSNVSTYSQLMQTALGTLVFVIGMYLVIMAAAAVMFGSELFGVKGLLSMLNALVYIIIAMMICLLISVLAPSENSVSMISNVIGLGMSFMCGVFVPQSLLGGTALNIGKLLPAFWYVKANNIISEREGELFSAGGFLVCIGVQLIFAAALMCVTLVIAKNKRRSEA